MPYFKRMSYAEAKALREGARPEPTVDVLALARDVLATETGDGAPPLRLRAPLRPGTRGRMAIDLSLEPGVPSLTVSLVASDLVGPAGRIPASLVSIAPATMTLQPGVGTAVEVSIEAPASIQPGSYTGTLSLSGDEAFRLSVTAMVA